jgi:hypothetical protein
MEGFREFGTKERREKPVSKREQREEADAERYERPPPP